MLNVAGHESHLSPYPTEPCQKCRIFQPCGDQQPPAGSRQEKTDHIRPSCELPKEYMCYLEKKSFECLKMATCFENSISNLALRSIHDLSRETWRGKKPCFPLELLLLLGGEVMEWQCDSPLVSWHSHLDHARKFLWVNYELETWWSFPRQLALHSDFFSLLFIGQA